MSNLPTLHAMIDLETLSTGDDAAIVQIGVKLFSVVGGVHAAEALYNVALDDPKIGSINAETVNWWLEQDPGVVRSVFDATPRHPLRDCLVMLSTFLFLNEVHVCWGYPASFDLKLLSQAYSRFGWDVPESMSFRNVRCLATLKDVGLVLGVERPDRGSLKKHHALADAIHQAEWAVEILRALRDKAG